MTNLDGADLPAHELGYTLDQIENILETPLRIKAFERWMYGQTIAVDSTLGLIVYPHDLTRFLRGEAVID